MFICKYLSVNTHVCMYIWKPEFRTGCLPCSLSILIIERGSLMELELNNLATYLANEL